MLLLLLIVAGIVLLTLYRASQHEAAAEREYPPLGEIIEVNGTRVHAWVQGDGPDLVLIHGSSGNLRDFTFDIASRLAERYRVIALDRPGLGYTERLDSDGASIGEQATLLSAAAAQLGAENPIVLGQSYGGAVALAWGLDRPAAALVLVAPAANPWTTPLDTYYKITSHPVLGPLATPLITAWVPDSYVESSVENVFLPQPAPEGYAEYFGTGLTLRRASIREQALQRANLLGEITAQSKRYPEITIPVEIVHGEADDTVGIPVHSEPLLEQVESARLTRLPGIGHMPHHVAQDAVIAAVDRAAARAGLP